MKGLLINRIFTNDIDLHTLNIFYVCILYKILQFFVSSIDDREIILMNSEEIMNYYKKINILKASEIFSIFSIHVNSQSTKNIYILYIQIFILQHMNIISAINYQNDLQNNHYILTIQTLFYINQINYWSGNPIHQIKEGTLFFKSNINYPNYQDFQSFCGDLRQTYTINQQCIAMVGIPISKSPIEVLSDLRMLIKQSHVIIEIEEIKVLRTESSEYYILAIKFAEKQDSEMFYRNFFGRKFNPIEKYRIILRQIQSIVINFDPTTFITFVTKKAEILASEKLQPEFLFQSYPFTLESVVYSEFKCPICNKQMLEENNQLEFNPMIILLCSHYFHSYCLEVSDPIDCPICKYPVAIEQYHYCDDCNSSENNWICQKCLKIFCCNPNNAQQLIKQSDAWYHFLETNHDKFIQIDHRRILNFEKQKREQCVKNRLTYERFNSIKNQNRERFDRQYLNFQEKMNDLKKNHKLQILKYKEVIQNMKVEIQTIDVIQNFEAIQQQILSYEKESEMHNKVHNLLADRITSLNKVVIKKYNFQESMILELNEQIEKKKKKLIELETQIKQNKQRKSKHPNRNAKIPNLRKNIHKVLT